MRPQPRADAGDETWREGVGAEHLGGEARLRLDERVVRVREDGDLDPAAAARLEPLDRETWRDVPVATAVQPQRGDAQLSEPRRRIDPAAPRPENPCVDLGGP